MLDLNELVNLADHLQVKDQELRDALDAKLGAVDMSDASPPSSTKGKGCRNVVATAPVDPDTVIGVGWIPSIPALQPASQPLLAKTQPVADNGITKEELSSAGSHENDFNRMKSQQNTEIFQNQRPNPITSTSKKESGVSDPKKIYALLGVSPETPMSDITK